MQKLPLTAQTVLKKAIAAQQKKRFAEAIELYKKVLNKFPQNVDALQGLSLVMINSGDTLAAINILGQALQHTPNDPQLRNNYLLALCGHGNTLANQHSRYQEALGFYEQAIKLNPQCKEAWNSGGLALEKLGRPQHALMSYEKAISCAADYVDALKNRATLLMDLQGYVQAGKDYAQVLQFTPDDFVALAGKIYANIRVCDWADYAIDVARLEQAAMQGKHGIEANFIMLVSDSAEAQLHCAKANLADKLAMTDAKYAQSKPLSAGRYYKHDKIRLAYISPDLREHAFSFLAARLFELHDKNRFEITAISLFQASDPMRERLKLAFDDFIDVHDKTDLQVAQLLREREIDIAIDLVGYTEHCRPGIFMHHAAPIQVQYLGYPGTTGAPYMDYVVVDNDIVPPDQEPFFSEKVVIMPDTYQVTDNSYKIILPLPTRQQVGLPETGFVFCSFNAIYKITPAFFDIWMRLLAQVDGSILWLLGSNDDAIKNLRQEAQKRGVDPSRIIFAPHATHDEHISRIRLADLVLDNLPVNAHTTASDTLLAGVPLVTCMGSSLAARVAGSILRAAEMPELITDNLQDYENLALKIARTPELLQTLRAKLANQLNTCALFDTDRFRRHLESAYTTMLERYENGEKPSKLVVQP